MYNYVKGDLIEFFGLMDVDVVLHCCNCQGVMGSGIAATIKEDFPEAYEAYKEYEAEHGLTLGSVSYGCINFGMIMNLHAQDFYRKGGESDGRFVDYEALYRSLTAAKKILENRFASDINDGSPIKVGLPHKMAAERAGGDWNVVLAMVKSVFSEDDERFPVTVVEYDGTKNA